MDLLQQFKEQWPRQHHNMQGCPVLLTVSGGVDSMVMAHLFLGAGIPFAIAHCNFGLRAEASDLDEQLVTDWCTTHNIPFHTTRFDTKQSSAEWKKGTQETARILRYEWFGHLRKEHGYWRIATAHHANDNVETLLINLFRGTGIAGIHGILPENGYIIRPLLFAAKEAILAYAAQHSVPYRDDASNETDDYLRNAVRHNIVPVMQQWFPNAIENVNESIARFAEAEQLYRKALEQERRKLMEKRGQDHYIPLLKLQKHTPLATIVYELLLPFGFTAAQLPHVLNLLGSGSGHFMASSTHRIIRDRDFLIITALPTDAADHLVIDAAPCTVVTDKYRYSFSIQPRPQDIPADPNIACLDLDTIEFPLTLRKWRTGDYLYPLGMKMKKKKVGRLLIDARMPIHDKEHIRILECGKRIAWVSRIRPDERFRVTGTTQKVLMVKCELL